MNETKQDRLKAKLVKANREFEIVINKLVPMLLATGQYTSEDSNADGGELIHQDENCLKGHFKIVNDAWSLMRDLQMKCEEENGLEDMLDCRFDVITGDAGLSVFLLKQDGINCEL